MTILPVSPDYRQAVIRALVIQALTSLFLLLFLDGGAMARAGGAAMLGFWIGVGIVVLRRPTAPSKLDLLFVRWGYLPMLVVAIACSPLVGTIRGE